MFLFTGIHSETEERKNNFQDCCGHEEIWDCLFFVQRKEDEEYSHSSSPVKEVKLSRVKDDDSSLAFTVDTADTFNVEQHEDEQADPTSNKNGSFDSISLPKVSPQEQEDSRAINWIMGPRSTNVSNDKIPDPYQEQNQARPSDVAYSYWHKLDKKVAEEKKNLTYKHQRETFSLQEEKKEQDSMLMDRLQQSNFIPTCTSVDASDIEHAKLELEERQRLETDQKQAELDVLQSAIQKRLTTAGSPIRTSRKSIQQQEEIKPFFKNLRPSTNDNKTDEQDKSLSFANNNESISSKSSSGNIFVRQNHLVKDQRLNEERKLKRQALEEKWLKKSHQQSRENEDTVSESQKTEIMKNHTPLNSVQSSVHPKPKKQVMVVKNLKQTQTETTTTTLGKIQTSQEKGFFAETAKPTSSKQRRVMDYWLQQQSKNDTKEEQKESPEILEANLLEPPIVSRVTGSWDSQFTTDQNSDKPRSSHSNMPEDGDLVQPSKPRRLTRSLKQITQSSATGNVMGQMGQGLESSSLELKRKKLQSKREEYEQFKLAREIGTMAGLEKNDTAENDIVTEETTKELVEKYQNFEKSFGKGKDRNSASEANKNEPPRSQMAAWKKKELDKRNSDFRDINFQTRIPRYAYRHKEESASIAWPDCPTDARASDVSSLSQQDHDIDSVASNDSVPDQDISRGQLLRKAWHKRASRVIENMEGVKVDNQRLQNTAVQLVLEERSRQSSRQSGDDEFRSK